MQEPNTGKVGKRGANTVAEEREDGILIRPAMAVPVEVYSPDRKAGFLLNNAVDEADYQAARAEVRALGLDPDKVGHRPPVKRRARPTRA